MSGNLPQCDDYVDDDNDDGDDCDYGGGGFILNFLTRACISNVFREHLLLVPKTNYKHDDDNCTAHRDTSPLGNFWRPHECMCAEFVCVCKCVCMCVCLVVTFGMVQAHLTTGAQTASESFWLLSSVRFLCVTFHVQGQVVRPGETPVAVSALERFRARVLPVVARQLVTAGEAPLAALPRALVRFFACMRSLVRLQVRTLGVDLFAAEELTLVYPPLRVWTVVVLPLVVFHC